MTIDEFYNQYFENLSNIISGFGSGSTHFVRIVDLMDADSLQIVEQSGASYPLLALEEFDEDEDKDPLSDLRTLNIKAGFLVLKAVSPDEGSPARVDAVKECRLLARKVFSRMIADNIARTGNTLFDNHITVNSKRRGIYLHSAGGGNLRGYRLEFEWEVKGDLIDFDNANYEI